MKDIIARIRNELEIGLNNFDSVKRTVDSVYLFGSRVTPGDGEKNQTWTLPFFLMPRPTGPILWQQLPQLTWLQRTWGYLWTLKQT
jgi:hypothetical protein